MISQCRLIEPFACTETDSVVDVAKKLHQFRQRHIYVVNKDMFPVGIISTSDMLERVIVAGKDPKVTKAKDIMTKDITVFQDADNAKEAYKVMNKKKIVSCPVVKDKKYLGTLTYNECLRFVTNPENS